MHTFLDVMIALESQDQNISVYVKIGTIPLITNSTASENMFYQ